MLSLTYGVRFGTPKIRCVFVSFSVKSKGTSPSQERYRTPSAPSTARTTRPPWPGTSWRTGRSAVPCQDHRLRNQSVGRTWSSAASGPRLWTLIRIRTSSGESLAYSTNTSK